MNVLIIGDIPRYIGVEEATEFQNQVVSFLEQRQCNVVVVGCKEIASPIGADLIVAIGRGHEVIDRMRGTQSMDALVQLASPVGVNHPTAQRWFDDGSKGKPPLELYAFTADQKLVLENAVKAITPVPIEVPVLSRQSASRRPGVR